VPKRAVSAICYFVPTDEQAGVFQLLESYADDAALAFHQQSAHFAELVASLGVR